MRLEEFQIKEDASAGATCSGNIATVVNPGFANPSRNSVAYTGKPGGPGGKGPIKQVKGGTYNTGSKCFRYGCCKLLSRQRTPSMITTSNIKKAHYMKIGIILWCHGFHQMTQGPWLWVVLV